MSRFKNLFRPRLLLIIIFAATFPAAAASSGNLARQAVSDDPVESEAAIRALRDLGYEGLDALLKENRGLISAHLNGTADSLEWQRAARAIDAVAKQKDAWASGLFWHTDLESALAEAKKSGKPIISLRLLGNLDEDLSCANSRFFRTLLYSDPRISEAMRSAFVLHWRSQRPAPRITVDFGNGRKRVTTVTGNSIHYFLSPDETIIDALPGLYAPDSFLEYLNRIAAAGLSEESSRAHRGYLLRKWRADLAELEAAPSETEGPTVGSRTPENRDLTPSPPTAIDSAPRAVTKMIAEADLLQPSATERARLIAAAENRRWNTLAERLGPVRFSARTVRVVRLKADPHGSLVEDGFSSMLTRLENAVALDTVRNEYLFHMRILEWLDDGAEAGLESLNRRVYSELFLTPDTDPWLGLDPSIVFNAVDNSGIRR